MFFKCFKELLGSPKLLQMTHLTTVPLKHQATGHQGTEGGGKCTAQHFPRAGQVAARPLNELQWRASVGSQTCGLGKKGSSRGKAPLSWSRLLRAAVVQPCRLCGFLIRSHTVEHGIFSSCTQRQHTGIALWPGCVTNDQNSGFLLDAWPSVLHEPVVKDVPLSRTYGDRLSSRWKTVNVNRSLFLQPAGFSTKQQQRTISALSSLAQLNLRSGSQLILVSSVLSTKGLFFCLLLPVHLQQLLLIAFILEHVFPLPSNCFTIPQNAPALQ